MRSLLENGGLDGVFGGDLELCQNFFIVILDHFVLSLLLSYRALEISGPKLQGLHREPFCL
jgi:hypothetical protein